MQSSIAEMIRRRIDFLVEHRDTLVIDADTHITDLDGLDPEDAERLESTPDYYHGRPISAELLIREMDMAEVDMALCWQNPAATRYVADRDRNLASLLAANRYVFESGRRYPDRILPAGWTDPKALGVTNAIRLVDACMDEFGFLVIKMNPAQNEFPIDSRDVLDVVDHIVDRGGIPAFHFGADTPYTPADGLETIAMRHPDHPVLAVHMGGGGAAYTDADQLYAEARELGLRCPNVHYALSAKRDTHIESDIITYQLVGPPFARNLFCASDAPYGRMTWNFGGFRSMLASIQNGENHTDERVRENPDLLSRDAVQNYLGRNFADLVIGGYRRLLEKRTADSPGVANGT